MNKILLTLAVLCGMATIHAPAQTQPSASAAAPPPPGPWEQWVQNAKNPLDWFSWGGDIRLRNEYFDNAITLDERAKRHEQDYFRFRGRVWASVAPLTNLNINARLTAEPREFMEPAFCSTHANGSGMEWRYGVFDALNVKWTDAFDQPLTLTAGRQDVMFGEPLNWWLVADGTPYDGSWTMFFDSLRATYEAKEVQTKLDLVYIYQNALPDSWIPTLGRSSKNVAPGLGPKPYYLTEQDEQGVILYASNKSLKNTQVDGYFIYKRDNRVHTDIIPNGDNANIYTVGGKVSGAPEEHWLYSAEGAYQFGNKQDPTVAAPYVVSQSAWRDLSAFGVNANLTYDFKDTLKDRASLAFEYLSGDDPKTRGTDEMFDVLWGRWPRFSELYIYSYVNENSGKIAQLNNLMRIGPTWSLTPVRNTTFSATYNALFAPESVPTRRSGAAAGEFSNDGHFRGHFVQTVLKHQFSKHVSGHLWGECLWERDYYTQHDLMTFVRAELMFTF
jgi:hypothetical protein